MKKGVGIVEAGEVSWGHIILGHLDFILKSKVGPFLSRGMT